MATKKGRNIARMYIFETVNLSTNNIITALCRKSTEHKQFYSSLSLTPPLSANINIQHCRFLCVFVRTSVQGRAKVKEGISPQTSVIFAHFHWSPIRTLCIPYTRIHKRVVHRMKMKALSDRAHLSATTAAAPPSGCDALFASANTHTCALFLYMEWRSESHRGT